MFREKDDMNLPEHVVFFLQFLSRFLIEIEGIDS